MSTTKITLNEITDEWLEVKKVYVKYSTYVKYKEVILTHIRPFFSEHADINDDAILKFLKEKTENEHLSVSTLHSIRFVLKSVLDYAEHKYEYKHIDFRYLKLPVKQMESDALTDQEIERLITYCFKAQDSIATAILLSLYAGLRLGEICALKWSDIDLKEGIITVTHTVQRLKNQDITYRKTTLMESIPKTDTSHRTVVMPDFLNAYLISYHYNIQNDETYVLTGIDKVCDPRTVQYRFRRVCQDNDFQTNFHTLRHTYATNCVRSGIDIKTLSEMLGHSDISITLNRYVHSSLEFKRTQVSKIKCPDIVVNKGI